MIYTFLASEYADTETALMVVFISVAFSAIIGRWWTLALPVILAAGVLGLASIDAFYERTPEDVQYSLVMGGTLGLGLAAAAILIRRFVADAIARRRNPHARLLAGSQRLGCGGVRAVARKGVLSPSLWAAPVLPNESPMTVKSSVVSRFASRGRGGGRGSA